MQKIGKQMSIVMGISLSFCLSLVGNLTSEHFSVPGFLISLAASIVLSLLIGLLVPMKPLTDQLCGKMPMGSLKRRLTESLISDLIYTPLITLLMITLAWFSAKRHGAAPPFLPMFLKSLCISMVVGYILIFLLMPLFLRRLMKEHGAEMRR